MNGSENDDPGRSVLSWPTWLYLFIIILFLRLDSIILKCPSESALGRVQNWELDVSAILIVFHLCYIHYVIHFVLDFVIIILIQRTLWSTRAGPTFAGKSNKYKTHLILGSWNTYSTSLPPFKPIYPVFASLFLTRAWPIKQISWSFKSPFPSSSIFSFLASYP